ncbi:MAG: hypothetical protein MI867_20950 [Pseudomonadales bacterium]|nr:hypothetical protein [Pseudomonadales bacterium]
MKKVLLFSAAAFCGISTQSFAIDDSQPAVETASYVKPVLGIGLNFGGDTIREYEVEYYDGDEGNEKVKAGEGIHFFAGVELGYPSSDLAVRLQAGYLFGGIFADNGDVSFDRVPLEALLLMGSDDFKFGVGLTHHSSVELEDDVAGDVSFDDATGYVLQGEYWVSKTVGLGLRYTKIEYEVKDVSGAELDGSGAGLYATFRF